jgi:predicted RNase H-like nuclease (RuvC/YqgF family)
MDRLKRLQDLESDLMAAEAEIERLQAHNLKLTDANVRLSDKVLRLRAKLEQIDNHITNRVRDKDAEIEWLQKRNALLEDVAVAAEDLKWGEGDPNLEKSANARLRNALDKLREADDGD